VNKMDLVSYEQASYEPIVREFGAFAGRLGFETVTFIPISALKGDNVVQRSERMPYYDGATLLELLERLPVAGRAETQALRYPVQLALRPNLDYRGYAGQVASGIVRAGDTVTILPSRKTTRVVGIDLYGESLAEAFAPMSVTLRLADEVDVSRGDMIVHAHEGELPRVENHFDAMLIWLHERPLDRAKSYLLKHTTQVVRAEVEEVVHQIDLETLEPVPVETFGLNDIGQVAVRTHRPLFVDAYADNRATGAFILIDSLTNDTVAAGMVLEPGATSKARAAPGLGGERTHVSPTERRARLGHGAMALVVPASGDAFARARAFAIERHLFDHGILATALVDDATGKRDKRDVAAALVRAGVVVVCVLDEGEARALAAQSIPLYALPAASGDDGAEALRVLTAGGVLGKR